MIWHYIENGRQAGPVDQATFDTMVSAGQIKPETQVWRDGMPNWAPYGSLASSGALASAGSATTCAECGNVFPAEDLVQIGDRAICAACKPIAVQKLKEGVIQAGNYQFQYAGFWIRVAAKIVDTLILYVVNLIMGFVVGLVLGLALHGAARQLVTFSALAIGFLIQFGYSIWFIGNSGSTLGMMACGIRVVMPDGGKVSYLRSTGRCFAEYLNFFTVYIGYIMIAFDEEKRALHDRICDTRVIYKK